MWIKWYIYRGRAKIISGTGPGNPTAGITFWLLRLRSRDIRWRCSAHSTYSTFNIITTPLTDHNAVSIFILSHSTPSKVCRNAYWKLNGSLLQYEKVKIDVKNIIIEIWDKARSENVFDSNWELLKYKAGQYLRQFGSTLAKNRRLEEEKVASKMIGLSQINSADISNQEKFCLISEQAKLNEIYLNKAKGAFVRSRKRWIEECEQNSTY